MYKNKKCGICGESFSPITGNQKYCDMCKDVNRKNKTRIYDRKRNRKRYDYKERTVICEACGKKFRTYYTKKRFCGSVVCEEERLKRKNVVIHLRRDKKKERIRKSEYYHENRELCLSQRANRYRATHITTEPYVFGKKTANHTMEFVRDYLDNFGYQLLSDVYINNCTKIKLLCPKGHEWETTFHNFQDGGARCLLCFKENNRGENYPSWKGGISCESYCEKWVEKEFKEIIKERDDYQCQNPDCWRKDGRAGMLCIHHIDYVKKNCDLSNLITLCNSCNARANTNREQHTNWYQAIIDTKYNSV